MLAALYAVVVWLGSLYYWSADCCYYANIFEADDAMPLRPVQSLADIAESQLHHYMTWTGRVLTHSIEQVFCALVPRAVFVALNGLAWVVFVALALRVASVTLSDWRAVLLASLLSLGMFSVLAFDPVFMVGYVWMGALSLLFLIGLRDNWKGWFAIVALFAGMSQEVYAVPLAGALFCRALKCRRRLTRRQLWFIATYLLGAAILVFAPGNFVRLAQVRGEAMSLIYGLREALPSLLVALISVGILLTVCGHRLKLDLLAAPVLSMAAVFELLFIALMGTGNMERMLVGFNVFVLLLILSALRWSRSMYLWLGALCIAGVMLIVSKTAVFKANWEKYSLIERLYHESSSGDVFIPDEMFFRADDVPGYYNDGWIVRERTICPTKAAIRIMPESYRKLRVLCDGDRVVVRQIAPQAWVYVIPRKSDTILLFDRYMAGRSIGPRSVSAVAPTDILIDSTAVAVAGVYFNNKPYMRAEYKRAR